MSSHSRGQASAAHPKPLGCFCVEPVPGEFIDNDGPARAQKAADLIEDNGQAAYMMQRQARDCDIETWGFIQVFDPTATKDPPTRGFRIDCHDLVAGAV
jgi:hypothetical protein